MIEPVVVELARPGAADLLGFFALQLGGGLTASLGLLSPAQVSHRFYRTQFLIALGLATLATVFLWPSASGWVLALLLAGVVASFLGSLVWNLEGAPGGLALIGVATALLLGALGLAEVQAGFTYSPLIVKLGLGWALADDFTSAAMVGAATSAMLMGHSYLIAPAMSITPLMRLLGAMLVAVFLRAAVAAAALASIQPLWPYLETESWLWLGMRAAVGFGGVLVLSWMAWQAARIRSTQSATGILYVAVIFCFIGELISAVLRARGGLVGL